MISVYVEGVGVYAPGLVGWPQAAAVLSGQAAFVAQAPARLNPALLPADVRRRTTEHIRLAIEVASEAVQHAGCDASSLPSVFASSESDGQITHNICEEVASNNPQVSPTRFHNSVNNAPAGYWSMAAGSEMPSTSIAGLDASFAMGLLEACLQVHTEAPTILFVAHDTPLPEPLNAKRPMTAIFGAGLVLAREMSARAMMRLSVQLYADAGQASTMSDSALEHVRVGNPAARGLPLLQALAQRATVQLLLPYVGAQHLLVSLEPCP